ncbi:PLASMODESMATA CALLOSE-BINDING PROTEIN 3-like [Dioscorea cayenensis subsp. rotundata]|uniref:PLASMODESMATA CALLOSE-BINDING PROTEIN 3-like n=1 Tax=Dioscorea cayennensis subsp. rotundata TaxID=55577 RepID=A0AB40D2E3_DIOCR|nr:PLASMODESMATA CALLOSE-BINDING PROTEIN 3-like [Dioscorea cayenensis subsp. rotundata]
MAVLVFLVFMLAMSGGSDATWCVCKTDQPTTSQQKALDYACGAGADCTPILQNGACYNPNTVSAHCSYAANSYYQKEGTSSRILRLSPALPKSLKPIQVLAVDALFRLLQVLQGQVGQQQQQATAQQEQLQAQHSHQQEALELE